MAEAAPRARIPYAHGRLAGEALVYERLESTNATLRDMAVGGASEGTVVLADEQTAGRGRLGRSWRSPRGAGFYGSLLLRPWFEARRAQVLTFLGAVGVAEAVSRLGVSRVEIKWPNDVLVRGRKVCGVLVEASLAAAEDEEAGPGELDPAGPRPAGLRPAGPRPAGPAASRVEWAVVGIGVNLRPEAVPPGLGARATSLAAEGVVLSSEALLDPLLAAIGRWYGKLLASGPEPLLARWAELAPMAQGRSVTVDDAVECYGATTEGITPEGLLRVRREDGAVVELSAADVTLAGG